MATNPHLNDPTRDTMLNTINTDLGSAAIFRIFAGGQPADATVATTAANTVVASLGWTTNAFATASTGSMTANTINNDASAAGGTAAWFSLEKSTGTRVLDGSVGTSAADLVLNTVTIATGAAVSVSSFVITLP